MRREAIATLRVIARGYVMIFLFAAYSACGESNGTERRVFISTYLPTSPSVDRNSGYENLLYACGRRNGIKADQVTPDPCRYLLANVVTVHADGTIAATDPNGRRIISQLRLNAPEIVHFRRLWLEIIAMAERSNPQLYQRLLAFPDDLPNLSALRPPGGNDRPEGIEQSFHARRQRGQLADVY